MSWDLTIRSVEGNIGSLDAVRQIVSGIFPLARFGREPSGVEKVRAAEAQGVKFPSIIRESMISQAARHTAEFETEGISLRFHFGSTDLVRDIGLEVRGAGDPFPLLRQLAGVGGWQILDDSTGEVLSADTQAVGTGWQTYQQMLGQARDDE